MSDQALAALNARIEQLTSENTSLRAESKKHRLAKRQLSEQLAALRAEHDQSLEDLETVSQGYEELQGQYEASPNEWRDKFNGLQEQLRTRDHRDAWKEALQGSLHEKASVEKLWKEIDYKADTDQVDAERVTEMIGKAKEAAPYLFRSQADATSAAAPGGAQRPITTPRREAGPGGGKGLNEQRSPSAETQVETANGGRPVGRIA